MTDEEYDLLHPVMAIEEVAPATFHATYVDGERVEIVAETIVEALAIAELPDGFQVREEEVRPSLNPIWLERLRLYAGDPILFHLLASIEERVEAIGREEIEVIRWDGPHTEAA